MNWINQIKSRIGRFLLMRMHPAKKMQVHPIPKFSDLQDVGIIYNANSKDNEDQINRIAQYLRDQGKKVWMMGYIDEKTLPANKKFHLSSEYFWKEKLSFFQVPEAAKIGNFVSHKFDIMMNLYFENELPLQALSTLSAAKFSMGAMIENGLSYNDTMIDTGSDQSLPNLATQMVHYLEVINQA